MKVGSATHVMGQQIIKAFHPTFALMKNIFPSIRASHFRSHHCVLIHLVVASMTKKEPLIQRVSFIPTQFAPHPLLIWVGDKSNEPSKIINYRKINASTTKPRIWWRAIADGYLCANQELWILILLEGKKSGCIVSLHDSGRLLPPPGTLLEPASRSLFVCVSLDELSLCNDGTKYRLFFCIFEKKNKKKWYP